MNLLSLLTDSGALTEDDAKAVAEEARTSNIPVEVLLEKRGISVEDTLKRMVAHAGRTLTVQAADTTRRRMISLACSRSWSEKFAPLPRSTSGRPKLISVTIDHTHP